MIRSTVNRAAVAGALLLAAGCADTVSTADGNEPAIPVVSTYQMPPTTSAPTTSVVEPEPIDFPPTGLPVRAGSELDVGDVTQLRASGQWIFGMHAPSTLVRIDPGAGEVTELDVGLGQSRLGPAQYILSDDLVWVLGGLFRDTLVAVDQASMTQVRRVQLGDDHSIASNTPIGELWLLSLRSARRLEPANSTSGEPVELEVDPVAVAADAEAAWVALPAAAQIARIDAATGAITLIDTEPGPGQLVLDGTTLWVAHSPAGTISRIDTATARVVGVTDVEPVSDVAAATVAAIELAFDRAPDGT